MVRVLIILLLLTGCSTPKKEPTLGAMDKFFECLGDSSKCEKLKKNDE